MNPQTIKNLKAIKVENIEAILYRLVQSVDELMAQKKLLPNLSVGLSQGHILRGTPIQISPADHRGERWLCFIENTTCLWVSLRDICWLGMENPENHLETLSAGQVMDLKSANILSGLELRKKMLELSEKTKALYALSLSFDLETEKKLPENLELRFNVSSFCDCILAGLELVASDPLGLKALQTLKSLSLHAEANSAVPSALTTPTGLQFSLPEHSASKLTAKKISEILTQNL